MFSNLMVGASSIIKKEGLAFLTLICLVIEWMMVAITGENAVSYLGLLTTEMIVGLF